MDRDAQSPRWPVRTTQGIYVVVLICSRPYIHCCCRSALGSTGQTSSRPNKGNLFNSPAHLVIALQYTWGHFAQWMEARSCVMLSIHPSSQLVILTGIQPAPNMYIKCGLIRRTGY